MNRAPSEPLMHATFPERERYSDWCRKIALRKRGHLADHLRRAADTVAGIDNFYAGAPGA